MITLPSNARVLWLFVRLRVQRMRNTLGRGKRTTNPILMSLVALGMVFGFFSIHQNALTGLVKLGDGYLAGLATYASMLWLAAWLMSLASRDFARAEWDLEWLITLPLAKERLVFLRVAERTLTNQIALLAFVPLFALLAYRGGVAWYLAGPAGLLFALPLLLIVATLQTVVDTGLRVHLKPSQIRNLQGVFNVLAIITLYASLGFAGRVPPAIEYLRVRFGDLLLHTPAGWGVRLINAPSVTSGMLYVGSALLICALGMAVLARLLRAGIVAGSGRESGGRGVSNIDTRTASGWRLTPMARKEFLLLARDRNYLVQTVAIPILMIALQAYLNTEGMEGPVSLKALAAFAFGMIAYAMLFSVFGLLRSEGASLWLLFTLPRPIDRLVLSKARAWYPMLVLYGVAFAAFAWWRFGPTVEYVWNFGLVLVGVPIFTMLATSLGIYAFDPNEVEGRQKPTLVYLYMLMASIYSSTFFQSDRWTAVVSVVLVALLAAALWQKASLHLRYLLDPTAAPPPRVALADGLVATYGFFILQLLVALVLGGWREGVELTSTSFAVAGLVTFGACRWSFRRKRAVGVPRFGTLDPGCAVLYGACVGVACAILAHVYLDLVYENGWFTSSDLRGTLERADRGWLFLMAVLAAPVFEEYIFRGLVLGGLRTRTWLAILISAALFAVVHPAVAALPVFVLGVGNACLALRFRGLAAPIVAHAIYNGAMLVVPWMLAN